MWKIILYQICSHRKPIGRVQENRCKFSLCLQQLPDFKELRSDQISGQSWSLSWGQNFWCYQLAIRKVPAEVCKPAKEKKCNLGQLSCDNSEPIIISECIQLFRLCLLSCIFIYIKIFPLVYHYGKISKLCICRKEMSQIEALLTKETTEGMKVW